MFRVVVLSLCIILFSFFSFLFFIFIWLAMFQSYSIITSDSHVMLHNNVIVHCTVPSHLTDWVTVISWLVEEKEMESTELSYNNIFGSLVLPDFDKKTNFLLKSSLKLISLHYWMQIMCAYSMSICWIMSTICPYDHINSSEYYDWNTAVMQELPTG